MSTHQDLPSRVEVVAIGDELLDGRVADTNAHVLAKALAPWGVEIERRATVRDRRADIQSAVRDAVARKTSLCVLSGGLGPTSDDITADVLGEICGGGVMRNQAQCDRIQEYLHQKGRTVAANQLRQAEIPKQSTPLQNPTGLALGFVCRIEGTLLAALPGVPREYEAMLMQSLWPMLQEHWPGFAALHAGQHTTLLYTYGLAESEVDRRLAVLATDRPAVRVGYRAAFPEIHVRFSAADKADVDGAAAFAQKALGSAIYGQDLNVAGLPAATLAALSKKGHTLAVAESCTGGLLASTLTDVPGASSVFLGGVVAYANGAKASQLGVDAALIEAHGAVSQEVVLAMAQGVRARFGASVGVGISGIAGPDGGSKDKPVGTVWVGVDVE